MVAAHPLRKYKPYNAIKFARVDGIGTPLYTVGADKTALGPAAALKSAFEQFGAHCFYCETWVEPQPMSQAFTRDHVRPTSDGGEDYLHNLVFACGPCNRHKGGNDLITFRAERGIKYLNAMDAHIVGCLKELGGE
jgi:5-methylcytosine-specific restriction endonuclease McrA